jgi:hypothetical protein
LNGDEYARLLKVDRMPFQTEHQGWDTKGLQVFEKQLRHWLHLDNPNPPGVIKLPPPRFADPAHPAEHHPDHRERVREVAHTTTHHHTPTNHFNITGARDSKKVAGKLRDSVEHTADGGYAVAGSSDPRAKWSNDGVVGNIPPRPRFLIGLGFAEVELRPAVDKLVQRTIE